MPNPLQMYPSLVCMSPLFPYCSWYSVSGLELPELDWHCAASPLWMPCFGRCEGKRSQVFPNSTGHCLWGKCNAFARQKCRRSDWQERGIRVGAIGLYDLPCKTIELFIIHSGRRLSKSSRKDTTVKVSRPFNDRLRKPWLPYIKVIEQRLLVWTIIYSFCLSVTYVSTLEHACQGNHPTCDRCQICRDSLAARRHARLWALLNHSNLLLWMSSTSPSIWSVPNSDLPIAETMMDLMDTVHWGLCHHFPGLAPVYSLGKAKPVNVRLPERSKPDLGTDCHAKVKLNGIPRKFVPAGHISCIKLQTRSRCLLLSILDWAKGLYSTSKSRIQWGWGDAQILGMQWLKIQGGL